MTTRPATRKSRQREAVLSTLKSMCTHPTAEEVYMEVKRQIPAISLGTVYRNLDFLASRGDIACLDFSKTMRFDGDLSCHNHVFCTSCGRIDDICGCADTKPGMETITPEDLKRLVRKAEIHSSYCISGYSLVFKGLCPECGGTGRA